MSTKQCNKCHYWTNPFTGAFGETQGWCEAPLPSSVADIYKMPMIEDEGTDCDVFIPIIRKMK